MKKIVQVFRSAKKEGAYLYLLKDKDQSELPAALMKVFGKAELAMTLVLTPERKLADTTAEDVLKAIESQGFYLKMPSLPDAQMQKLAIKNVKLSQHG